MIISLIQIKLAKKKTKNFLRKAMKDCATPRSKKSKFQIWVRKDKVFSKITT